jgi:hypothetical protein
LLIAFFFGGCQKDTTLNESPDPETVAEKFFDPGYLSSINPHIGKVSASGTRNNEAHKSYNAADNGQINAVIRRLLAMPQNQAQLEGLVAEIGYPAWDKSRFYKGTKGEKLLVTAFAHPDADTVSGVLVALTKGTETLFALYRKPTLVSAFERASDAEKPCIAGKVFHLLTADRVLFEQKNEQLSASIQRYLSDTDAPCMSSRCTVTISTEETWNCYWTNECCYECQLIAVNVVYSFSACGGGGGGGGGGGDPYGGWPTDPYGTGNTGGGGTTTGGSGTTSGDISNYVNALGSNAYNLIFTESQRAYLQGNETLANEIRALLDAEGKSLASEVSSKISVDIMAANLLYGPYEGLYNSIVTSHLEGPFPYFVPTYQLSVTQEVVYLRLAHPNWSHTKVILTAFTNVLSGTAHTLLDIAGFLPGAGEIADFANGVLYIIEGDGMNASISFASMLPIAGDWVAKGYKYSNLLIKGASGRSIALVLRKGSDGYIKFGSKSLEEARNQLRTVLGKKIDHQAHHVIPWEFRNHPVVQEAAKWSPPNPNTATYKTFHMNDHVNGLYVHNTRHNGSHPNYSVNVFNKLEEIQRFLTNQGKFTPENAVKEINLLAQKIKTAINTQTTVNVNNITF